MTNDDVTPAGGPCILVAEDEPSVRRLITRGLEHLGHEVLSAEHSQEAEALWQKHEARIALLITDLRMPGGRTGWQLAELLREQRPDLKVLFITGYSNDLLQHAGELEENEDYIQKPFNVSLLGEVVGKRLRGAPTV